MIVNPAEMKALLSSPGPARYKYFVKKVTDSRKVWGLWMEGWAMGRLSNGMATISFWPAKEFADACAIAEWERYEAKSIPINTFLETLLPSLKRDGVTVCVFDTPQTNSVSISVEDLTRDLSEELEKY